MLGCCHSESEPRDSSIFTTLGKTANRIFGCVLVIVLLYPACFFHQIEIACVGIWVIKTLQLSLSVCNDSTEQGMCLVVQSCPTLCNPTDCSPAGSSIHENASGKNTGVGCYALLQTGDRICTKERKMYILSRVKF